MVRYDDEAGAMTNARMQGIFNGSVYRSMTLDGITRSMGHLDVR
jgi:hypothetical protein